MVVDFKWLLVYLMIENMGLIMLVFGVVIFFVDIGVYGLVLIVVVVVMLYMIVYVVFKSFVFMVVGFVLVVIGLCDLDLFGGLVC